MTREKDRAAIAPTTPALFVGKVGHRRSDEAHHQFEIPVFYAYFDVDRVDGTLDSVPFWSARRAAPMRFRAEDHLDGSGRPLGHAVRDLVADRTGSRPRGRILLLTQVRTFGFVFNPISVFVCWNDDNASIEAVVLEVTSTPWKERCWYVLTTSAEDGPSLSWTVPKAMHVSPFLDMGLTYRIRLDGPGERLRLRIDAVRHNGSVPFSADLDLRRVPLDTRSAIVVPLRHPLQTWRIFASIHTHAARLWRKGVVIRQRPVPPHAPRGVVPTTPLAGHLQFPTQQTAPQEALP